MRSCIARQLSCFLASTSGVGAVTIENVQLSRAWPSVLQRGSSSTITSNLDSSIGSVNIHSFMSRRDIGSETAPVAASPFLVPLTERGTPVLPSDPSVTGRTEMIVHGRPVYFENQGTHEDICRFPVYNWKMEVVRTIDLPGSVFNERIRPDLMHRYFVWQMARRRQGTHKTKHRGEVRGGGRKPWPQKGTGRAPLGSIRAPQCRGGGHVKEKRPKDWSIGMNVKERRFALRSALSAKAFEGRLFVMEDLGAPSDKTRDMAARCEAVWPRGLRRDGSPREELSVLLVDRGKEDPRGGERLRRVSRNIPGIEVIAQRGLQVKSLLKRTWLGISEDALWDLVERLQRPVRLRQFRPLQVIPWPPPPPEELEAMTLPVEDGAPKVLPWMAERGWDPVHQRWVGPGESPSPGPGEAQG